MYYIQVLKSKVTGQKFVYNFFKEAIYFPEIVCLSYDSGTGIY